MGKIIAVANQKGGVGKTTTAINLSAALAEKGKKTLLVDLDSQSNATSGAGIEKLEVENSIYELISGLCSFDECVEHTGFSGLDVIPSSADLTAAEIELLDAENREAKLKNVLDLVRDQYKFIIIDCPPSLNMLTVNAMTAADSVLIPIQCEYYALEGLSLLLDTISLVKERINPELSIEGIVFTMYDPRVRLSGQVVQNVKQNLNEKMFKTVIPRNVRLAEAPSHGKPIMYYTRFCSGTRAYRNLAKEVIAAYSPEFDEPYKKLNEAVNPEETDEENKAEVVEGAETEVASEDDKAAVEKAVMETAVDDTIEEDSSADDNASEKKPVKESDSNETIKENASTEDDSAEKKLAKEETTEESPSEENSAKSSEEETLKKGDSKSDKDAKEKSSASKIEDLIARAEREIQNV